MIFKTSYHFLEYLYDQGLLEKILYDADGGYGGRVVCYPEGSPEKIKLEVETIIRDKFSNETGHFELSKDPVEGLVFQTSRYECLELWDEIHIFSEEIMMVIAESLDLPEELFKNTRFSEPRIFADLNISVDEDKVKESKIEIEVQDYSDSINEIIEQHSLKINKAEIFEKVKNHSETKIGEKISEYVMNMGQVDFIPNGFNLSFSEYNISNLGISGFYKVLLKDTLSVSNPINIEDIS